MNRYQIILESEEALSDQEFLELIERNFLKTNQNNFLTDRFNIVEAINLEGIVLNFDDEDYNKTDV